MDVCVCMSVWYVCVCMCMYMCGVWGRVHVCVCVHVCMEEEDTGTSSCVPRYSLYLEAGHAPYLGEGLRCLSWQDQVHQGRGPPLLARPSALPPPPLDAGLPGKPLYGA